MTQKQTFKASQVEAQLLGRRYQRHDHMPYEHVVEGAEYVVSPEWQNTPLNRHNLYNVINYLEGRDPSDVATYLDHVHGQAVWLPCGCKLQFMFDHSKQTTEARAQSMRGHRKHHGEHKSHVCNGCKKLDNGGHDYAMSILKDHQEKVKVKQAMEAAGV